MCAWQAPLALPVAGRWGGGHARQCCGISPVCLLQAILPCQDKRSDVPPRLAQRVLHVAQHPEFQHLAATMDWPAQPRSSSCTGLVFWHHVPMLSLPTTLSVTCTTRQASFDNSSQTHSTHYTRPRHATLCRSISRSAAAVVAPRNAAIRAAAQLCLLGRVTSTAVSPPRYAVVLAGCMTRARHGTPPADAAARVDHPRHLPPVHRQRRFFVCPLRT